MAEPLANAKYAKEFKKATTLSLPQGYERKKYDLGWALANQKITYKEYARRLKKLQKDYNITNDNSTLK